VDRRDRLVHLGPGELLKAAKVQVLVEEGPQERLGGRRGRERKPHPDQDIELEAKMAWSGGLTPLKLLGGFPEMRPARCTRDHSCGACVTHTLTQQHGVRGPPELARPAALGTDLSPRKAAQAFGGQGRAGDW
jgi:hypothetical protein